MSNDAANTFCDVAYVRRARKLYKVVPSSCRPEHIDMQTRSELPVRISEGTHYTALAWTKDFGSVQKHSVDDTVAKAHQQCYLCIVFA